MRKRVSGFTLIELLIVLVIVGFMGAMVTPALSKTLASLKLHTAARKVAAAIRYARTQAVVRALDYQVTFRFEERELSVSPVAKEGEEIEKVDDKKEIDTVEGKGERKTEEREKKKVYQLPEEVKFLEIISGEEGHSSGEALLTFHPDGSSDGAEIVLSDKEGKRQFRIVVHFLTGSVELGEKV